MTSPSRRTLLGATASLCAISAGCLGDRLGSESDGNGDGNGSPDTDETGTETDDGSDDSTDSSGNETDGSSETDDGSDDTPTELVDHETHAYRYPKRSTSPDVALLQNRDRAQEWLAEREPTPEEIADVIDDTDFETSILVPIEAGAPNPCHELVLESIEIDDGDGDDTLALEAAVQEQESTGEEAAACIAQETTVGRLVRATFEPEPLTRISASVVDRHGKVHGMGMASGSASASESASSSHDQTESDT
ncbi:hypothetical protein [Natrinema ejinorense]|uniref:Uncharacterized protein n=1 Tax=Natrinema ejinorense TaxID=373386 RepID=A0A2A5QV52_9EURY|nr:hypothetical protein [Natrinema ejinorense]PCR90629.1 hypothetical protein CP557_08980 [Natrinema ejinorense]